MHGPPAASADDVARTSCAASSASFAGAVVVDSVNSDPDMPLMEIVETPPVPVEGNFSIS